MDCIPKVSSITYVKNGKDYVERCIRSVMEQTLKEIEIIVVDGGSTDGTLEIIQSLQAQDERIKLLHKAGSVGAQFNVALGVATGEYISVCEGDDFILPEKYEKQYCIAKTNDLDVLRAPYHLYFEYKEKEYHYRVEVADAKEYYNCLIETAHDQNMFLATFVNGFWNGLYSRKFLTLNNILMNETKGAAFQDITFSFLTQLLAKRIWFMDEPCHCYRINNPNSSVNSSKCREMLMTEYDLLKEQLIERGIWEENKHMFLVWEMYSYKQFADRFPKGEKEDFIREVYPVLISQKISYQYDDLKIYHKNRVLIDALYSGEDSFYDAMTKTDDQIEEVINYFKGDTFAQDEEIVLFGAGHFGGIIYDFLNLCGKRVRVLDNSVQLQREGFKGQVVYNPNEITIKSDATVIIASVEHAQEIDMQLLGLGVERDQIVVCDNEDFFIREIYMGFGFYLGEKGLFK